MNAYIDTSPEKALNFLADDRIALCLHLPPSLTRETASAIAAFSRKHRIDALVAANTLDYDLYAVRKSAPVIVHTKKPVADMLLHMPKKVSGVWHDDPSGGQKIGSLDPLEIAWQEVVEYMHLKRKLDYLISFNAADSYKFAERVKRLAGWTGGMVAVGEKGELPSRESVERISELAPHCPLLICSSLQEVGEYLPYIHGVIIDLTPSGWNASVIGEYVRDLKHAIATFSR